MMLLNEISQEYADQAYEFIEEADADQLPFDDIFGDKWRTTINFPSRIDSDSTIGEIIQFFDENNHEVDVVDASTTYSYRIPAGPKEGEMTSSTSKIGKRINGLISFMENFIEANQMAIKAYEDEDLAKAEEATSKFNGTMEKFNDIYPNFYLTLDRHGDLGDLHTIENYAGQLHKRMGSQRELDEADRRLKDLEAKLKSIKEQFEDWANWWNANSKEIVNNPESLYQDYKIVLSRHPIDILRMGDFDKMRDSCMKEGGIQFECTLAEMRSNGAVAYLVKEDNLEEYVSDLQSDEIFQDRKRDIPGVEPVSRTRLRRVAHLPSGTEVAVPNMRLYGDRIEGFAERVQEYAREQQSEKFELLDQESQGGYSDDMLMSSNLALWGGSSTDTDLFSRIEELLGMRVSGGTFAKQGGDPKKELEWARYRSYLQQRWEDIRLGGSDVKITEDGPVKGFEVSETFEFLPKDQNLAKDVELDGVRVKMNQGVELKQAAKDSLLDILKSMFDVEIAQLIAYPASQQGGGVTMYIDARNKEDLEVRSIHFFFGEFSDPGLEGAEQNYQDMLDFFDKYEEVVHSKELIREAFSKEMISKGFFEAPSKQEQMLSDIIEDGKNPFDNFQIEKSSEDEVRFVLDGEYEEEWNIVGSTFHTDEISYKDVLRRKTDGISYRINDLFAKKFVNLKQDALKYAKKQLSLLSDQGFMDSKVAYDTLEGAAGSKSGAFIDYEAANKFSDEEDVNPSASEGVNTIPVAARIKLPVYNIDGERAEAFLAIIEYLDDHTDELLKAANEALQVANKEALEAARSRGEASEIIAEGSTLTPSEVVLKEQLRPLVEEFLKEECYYAGRS